MVDKVDLVTKVAAAVVLEKLVLQELQVWVVMDNQFQTSQVRSYIQICQVLFNQP
jgi:hypothetical protein